jgi:hypothetical protein
MDQRVTHAAVTENKRLSAVLEHIKERQDATPPKPKVRTNSEKMGYQPRGRKKDIPEAVAARIEKPSTKPPFKSAPLE